MEISIVLLIVGLVVGAIAIPIATRLESRRIEDTTRLLDLAQEKLLAYALKYGYFPCPALEGTSGQEPGNANHTSGFCPQYHGYLPAAALGWTPVDAQGFAVDAWGTTGSRIRYAVSSGPVDTITAPFTRVNGLANAGIAAVGSASLLHICGSGTGVNGNVDCGSAPRLATNAAIVVWSVGPNALTGGTNVHEAQNPNPNNAGGADRIFVSRPRSGGGSEPDFDDIVRWTPGPIVSGKLQVAGMMTPSSSGSGGTGGGGGTYGTTDSDDDDD